MKNIFILFNSSNKNKRYTIKTEKKTIHFGSPLYENYTIHKNIVRKNAYINRHEKNEDWSNPYTAGFWSKHLLWNKPTLNESIKDTEKRFNIKIINSIV